MEEIHHSDRWSAAASRTAMCGSVFAFGDDLVSQSSIQALITYGDRMRADSYYSATEKNMVHFALKFFNPGMKSYSFGLISLSVGEAVLPLANEVFLDQSTCK